MTQARANDLLKASFTPTLWRGVTLAAVVHFAILVLSPRIGVADIGRDGPDFYAVEVPTEFRIPPPPEEIARPAVPVLSSDISIDPEATIAPTTFSDSPPVALPAPPPSSGNTADAERFTPFEARPELRNADEYLRALERQYPTMLRDAGIGGTVVLWVHIDERGAVRETDVVQGSGYAELDDIAERVMAEVARFTPALNRDQRVPVWVQIPVTFTTR